MDRDRWLEQAMEQWEVPLLRTCYLLVKGRRRAGHLRESLASP